MTDLGARLAAKDARAPALASLRVDESRELLLADFAIIVGRAGDEGRVQRRYGRERWQRRRGVGGRRGRVGGRTGARRGVEEHFGIGAACVKENQLSRVG